MENQVTVFEDREHEYRVAGWLGTLSVMSVIAQLPTPRHLLGKENENTRMIDFCKLVHDDQDIKYHVAAMVQNKPIHQETIQSLENASIMYGNSLNPDFSYAFDLYHNEDWRNHVVKETTFSRLCPIIDELSEYYTPNHIANNLPYFTQVVVHNIEFYSGHYDPGF